jgi:ATP-dependent Clp protease protease subunit
MAKTAFPAPKLGRQAEHYRGELRLLLRSFDMPRTELPVHEPVFAYHSRPTLARRTAIHIPIIGQIDERSLDLIRQSVATALKGVERIRLNINSPGGKVDEAFVAYDTLRSFPGIISAIASEECYSAALIVYLAADHRVAKPGTRFLIHGTHRPASGFAESNLNVKDLRRYAALLEETDNRVLDLLAARTGFCRSWFKAEMETEDKMDSEVALECGICHEIEG